MSFVTPHILEASLIGLLTGVFSGAFGIGGGTVSTPLLRLALACDAHIAVGTTMALIVPTSISGTVNYFRKGMIDVKLASIMVLPAVIGVVLGASSTAVITGPALMTAFAAFVALAGLDLAFGIIYRLISGEKYKSSTSVGVLPKDKLLLPAIGIGFIAGLMAGLFGVGGGFILVPCFLYFFGTPIKVAFGTSLVIVASVSVPGTITHCMLGHVNFMLMLSMMAGSIPGSFLGSHLALKMSDGKLRRIFGVILFLVAIGLVSKEIADGFSAACWF